MSYDTGHGSDQFRRVLGSQVQHDHNILRPAPVLRL